MENSFQDAIEYVKLVKTEFHNEPQRYRAFLSILHDYQANNQQPIAEVIRKVEVLFENHPHLIEGFSHFLPAKPPFNQAPP